MKIATSKIKAIGKALGVNLKVDKTLDKFSKVVPDKMKENEKMLSNSNLTFQTSSLFILVNKKASQFVPF